MALYYGFLISPTIPHTPRHKGKVESGVHYVKRNFMAGQEFMDINVGNVHLRDWIIEYGRGSQAWHHRRGAAALVPRIEKACLQPLPAQPFRLLEIRPVKVHPDCHVVISGSFYSVPFGYIGQELAAHVSENFVEIYKGQELVSTPPAQYPARAVAYPHGRLSTRQSRLPDPHTGLLQEAGSKDRPIHPERGGAAAGGSAARSPAFGAGHPQTGGERGAQTSGSCLCTGCLFRGCTLSADQADPECSPGS